MFQRTRRRWPALVLGLLAAFITTTAAAAPASAGPGPGGTRVDGPGDLPCYYASVCLYEESPGKLRVWSTLDVGPTPYYYSIFNMNTGARLALCGTGTGCSTTGSILPPPGGCYWYRGYVGSSSLYNPPIPVQRASTQLLICR